MKKYFFLCLLLLVMLAGQAIAATPENRLTEYEERRRAVAALLETATVWIVGEDAKNIGQGSGFLVGEGFIATNAHVVNEFGKGAVFYVLNDKIPATKAQIVAQLYDSKRGKDFALLRFSPPKGVELPILAFNLDAKRMDRVSAWGYPSMVTQFDSRTDRLHDGDTRGLKAPPVVFTEGSINSIVSGQMGNALIHSAQIAGGNSGGPLVNSRGEVVGINTWGYTEEGEGAFLNAALLANDLAVFLRAHGVNPKLVSGHQIAARSEPPAAQGHPEGGSKLPSPAKEQPGAQTPPGDSKFFPSAEEQAVAQAQPGGSKFFANQAPEKAEDRIRDVGSFTVKVPLAWSVVEEEEDSIMLGADDDSAIVSIMIDDSEGQSLRQISQAIAREFDAKPVSDDGGETYTFTFTEDDVEFLAVTGDMGDGRYILFLIGGDMNNPGVEQILDSVEDK